MTTIFDSSKTCKMCGILSNHKQICSTNAFGPGDLDMRPPEMKRSTMPLWIEICPECGYVAVDIREGSTMLKSIIEGEEYQIQLKNPLYPPLANAFLCQSILLSAEKDFTSTAWASLHAAWACDDANKEEFAKKCRNNSISYFIQAKERNSEILEDTNGTYHALMTDLYRRSKSFVEAEKFCRYGIDIAPTGIVNQILRFELQLIQQNDSKRHHIGEII